MDQGINKVPRLLLVTVTEQIVLGLYGSYIPDNKFLGDMENPWPCWPI